MLGEAYSLFSEAFTILQQVCSYIQRYGNFVAVAVCLFIWFYILYVIYRRLLVQCTGRLLTAVGMFLIWWYYTHMRSFHLFNLSSCWEGICSSTRKQNVVWLVSSDGSVLQITCHATLTHCFFWYFVVRISL